MDKMYIRELKIYANHGVLEEEKRLGQLFIVSLEMDINLKKAGKSGRLDETVNYSELCERVINRFCQQKFDLIETAALDLAEYILEQYDAIQGIKVRLKKPWAPIHLALDTVEIMMTRSWHKAYIGLGSNMGDKNNNIKQALEYIEKQRGIKITKCSSLINTKPWGYMEQDDFINAVIEVSTFLEPEELLEVLLEIEKILGRERTIKWGPRSIDLDILMYDQFITHEDNLIIPHPRMHEREFVLKSLVEIAPHLIHPVLKRSMSDLIQDLE